MGVLATPFHPYELAAQARAGGGPRGAAIRDFMPEQHRDFFALLPYVFASAIDAEGWPVATMLTGAPGFLHAPDAATLRVDALPHRSDPAAVGFQAGRDLGLLGIDLATRRRNRANGRILERDANGFSLAVQQSFGNCPQYIQRRSVSLDAGSDGDAEPLASIDDEARSLVRSADTLFVASRSRQKDGTTAGADISHRGGRPGFVLVEGDRLTIPDFRGNRYFNTLGNLLGEPRGSLLFVDFERGDLLQLQGLVEIDWSEEAGSLIEGAQRLWRFQVVRGWRRRAASPLRWSFLDYAPTTERTGLWQDAMREAG